MFFQPLVLSNEFTSKIFKLLPILILNSVLHFLNVIEVYRLAQSEKSIRDFGDHIIDGFFNLRDLPKFWLCFCDIFDVLSESDNEVVMIE